jgi:hypothetical protein
LVALSLLPTLSLAAPNTVPTSLLPGQQYRLAFVTAGARDATSTNIADYDAFVTAEANTEAALSSISWQVIGSTASVSARNHTGTAPGDYPGVPIFLLNDVKLVDDYADLWDGSLDVALTVDQSGVTSFIQVEVWTGTGADGGGNPLYLLGDMESVVGHVDRPLGGYWVNASVLPRDHMYSFYALSEVLTVPVPPPVPILPY